MAIREVNPAKTRDRKNRAAKIAPPGMTAKSLVRWMKASPVLPLPTAAVGSGDRAKMVGMTAKPARRPARVSAKQMVVALRAISSRFFV